MRRTDRLFPPVDALRRPAAPSEAAVLAEEFSVSECTIDRDTAALSGLGVPK